MNDGKMANHRFQFSSLHTANEMPAQPRRCRVAAGAPESVGGTGELAGGDNAVAVEVELLDDGMINATAAIVGLR